MSNGFMKQKQTSEYPNTGEIIYLLGLGALLTASILIPGATYMAKLMSDIKKESDQKKWQKSWQKFNPYLLKRNIKRLYDQKVVEILKVNGEEMIKLTTKGRTKFLRFQLEKLNLNGTKWDGRWRLVIYDISKFKRSQQNAFRNMIKNMNLLQLQKSVYITPYPCEEQISYLREYFGISEEVLYIRADKIENEEVYRKYFGL